MRLHAQEAAIGAFILNRVGKRSTPRATTRHRAISSSWLPGSAQEEKPWYIQGKNDNDAAPPLPFDCTGCGKCCKTKGSVLMSPMEVFGASSLLKTTISEFKQQYVALEEQLEPEEAAKNQIGWVQLKNSKETGGCVFLDPETNYCKIYKARPLQCSSYPFWPRIMGSKQAWDREVVLSDDEPLGDANDKHWTPSEGGCEGMRRISDEDKEVQSQAPRQEQTTNGISAQDAHETLAFYKRYTRSIPVGKFVDVVPSNTPPQ